MTRRPQRARPARKKSKRAKSATRVGTPSDPLDDFIEAAARALDLRIDKSWMPAVRVNLQVTLRLGAMVTDFGLPDETEPAPVFEA